MFGSITVTQHTQGNATLITVIPSGSNTAYSSIPLGECKWGWKKVYEELRMMWLCGGSEHVKNSENIEGIMESN